MTRFYSGDRKLLDFSADIRIGFVFAWGSKKLVLVCRSKLNSVFCGGIEIGLILGGDRLDLISVMATKLTQFLCEGSNLAWV